MRCPKCEGQFGSSFLFCPYDGRRLVDVPPALPRALLPDLTGSPLETRYRIRRLLGEGAMARVYLAQNVQSGEPVAIKMLDPKRAGDREQRLRFVRECEIIRQIDHHNIVMVHEAGVLADGTPYLVFERLFGESVGDALGREGRFPPELAIPTLQQAAAALWAVHQQGIVHRDVKPDNLFLVGQPGDLRAVKILDFGLSRLFLSNLTVSGTVLGTPAYMAPEQVVAEPTDQRTDVYSLGMVMYRAFTGRLPFSVETELALLACQLLVPAPRPAEFARDIDRRAELVIVTATRKRPEQRYPSMAIFAEDLRRLENPRAPLWAHELPPEGYDLSVPQTASIARTFVQFLPPGMAPGPG